MAGFESFKNTMSNLGKQIGESLQRAEEESRLRDEERQVQEEARRLRIEQVDRCLYLDDLASLDKKYKKLSKKSEDFYTKIEDGFAVVRSFDFRNESENDRFLKMCEDNISVAKEIKPYWDKYEVNIKYVNAYKRAAMLCEKQGDYSRAADFCIRSIKDGFLKDGPNSGIRTRLVRMISKGKLELTQDITSIIDELYE